MFTILKNTSRKIRVFWLNEGEGVLEGGEKPKGPENNTKKQEEMQNLLSQYPKIIQTHTHTREAQGQIGQNLSSEREQLAIMAYQHLVPGANSTDPIIVGKIHDFLKDDTNFQLFQKNIHSQEGIQLLQGKIGITSTLATSQKIGTLNIVPQKSGQQSAMSIDPAQALLAQKQELSPIESIPFEPTPEEQKVLKEKIVLVDKIQSDHAIAQIEAEAAKEEYDGWMKNYKKIAEEDQKTEKDVNSKSYDIESNTHLNTDSTSQQQQQEEQKKNERIDNFLVSETGQNNANIAEIIKDSESGFHLEEGGIRISDPGWKYFPTEKQAKSAKIKYELFSQPPLDEIRRLGPAFIDGLKVDPDIIRAWQEANPNEPLTTKGLRRLFLISLMKKMNPGKYENMSYQAIMKEQSGPLTDQFSVLWNIHKIGGIQNTGTDGVSKMINLLKKTQWIPDKKEKGVPGWPECQI